MAFIDSNNFSINVNREFKNELGEDGRAQSEIVVYKGDKQLIPTSSTPTEGQFLVTITSTENCEAAIKNANIVYANKLTGDTGVITLNINVENKATFVKNINLVKSVTKEEISNIEKRMSIAEQKITEDAITSTVKKTFYTKSETNERIDTQMSTVEQTVNSWGVKISNNEKEISSLKLTDESFNVAIRNKADSSNIISVINASTEGITISSSKVNISGFVTFSDLSTSGKTTINGSNITTGTINGNLANITNINASNITSGYISGNRISGGEISGTTLRTATLGATTGVAIEANGIKIGATALFFNNSRFDLQCTATCAIGSMSDIYLMPGLNSSGTGTGSGTVVIPNATLRAQKLLVVNDTTIQGACAVSGQMSCAGLSAVSSISANNGFNSSNGGLVVTGAITTKSGNVNATSGQVSCKTLSVTSISTLNGAVTCGGSLTAYSIKSNSTLNCSSLAVSADMSVSGNAWIKYLYVNGTWVSSDKRLKTDIKYIDENTQVTDTNVNITTSDMHEFIETVPIVSFKLIDELNDSRDNTRYGFIIQDIMDTKVGSELTEIPKDEYGNETNGYYTYSQEKFITFICGALQKEIKLRKELEEKVAILEQKINKEE